MNVNGKLIINGIEYDWNEIVKLNDDPNVIQLDQSKFQRGEKVARVHGNGKIGLHTIAATTWSMHGRLYELEGWPGVWIEEDLLAKVNENGEVQA